MRVVFAVLLLGLSVSATAAEIVAGPMPGHSTMRQVKVWVQTDEPAVVQLRYRADADDEWQFSRKEATDSLKANTATLYATDLEPGLTYDYDVLVDEAVTEAEYSQQFVTQPLWQWREDPPPFTFALGSCAFINETEYDRPGSPYGGDYRIFDNIAEADPAFMLWLGDNVYYREADWNSRFGMYDRFSHTRGHRAMSKLVTETHHYAIWDDHDFGPNNSDRAYAMREQALEVFNAFWPNPDFSAKGTGGVTNYFEWHDVGFFLLDNRYFRQANYSVSGKRQILGDAQIDWLIEALKSSNASFKFVAIGGQVLNSNEGGESYIYLAPGERRELLDRIEAERIPGVIFLSGDRHHSALLKMDRYGTYPLYEWTVSPLTAGAHDPEDEAMQYDVEGSIYTERNFGLINVSGPRNERVLELMLHDSDGNEVWSEEIRQVDLQP
jgi:alkaline phosphatase D